MMMKIPPIMRKNPDITIMSGTVVLYFLIMRYIIGLSVSGVEFIGVFLITIAIALMRKEKVSGFVLAILASLILTTYFFTKGLLGVSMVGIVYIAINAVSIYSWLGNSGEKKQPLAPSRTKNWILWLVLAGLIIAVVSQSAHGPVFVLDAAVFYLDLSGKILLTRKKIEGWSMWILADLVGIVLFAVTGAYMSLLRAFITLGNGIAAAVSWRKKL